MLKVCGREGCAPVLESQYWVRCSQCGMTHGSWNEEETTKRWNYQMQIEQDNTFDNVATLQWEHNSKPFFVGNSKTGFWVKKGRKYEEYPG